MTVGGPIGDNMRIIIEPTNKGKADEGAGYILKIVGLDADHDGKIDVVTDSKKVVKNEGAAPVKSKALQLLEDATGKSRTAVAATEAVGAIAAGSAIKDKIVKAPDAEVNLKIPENPKNGQLKTPEAPTKMQAPSKPEITEAPEAPKSLKTEAHITKPTEMP
jgi:hypothetical protein